MFFFWGGGCNKCKETVSKQLLMKCISLTALVKWAEVFFSGLSILFERIEAKNTQHVPSIPEAKSRSFNNNVKAHKWMQRNCQIFKSSLLLVPGLQNGVRCPGSPCLMDKSPICHAWNDLSFPCRKYEIWVMQLCSYDICYYVVLENAHPHPNKQTSSNCSTINNDPIR